MYNKQRLIKHSKSINVCKRKEKAKALMGILLRAMRGQPAMRSTAVTAACGAVRSLLS